MPTDSIQIPGYEILRPLGSGGMSTVYLAQQRSLERKVAIKVMRRVFTTDVDAGQIEKRFLLEGRLLAKLPHRNIVAVYDIVSNDDIAYIAMEYLGGGVLSDRMRNGLSLADAVAVIVQIASALEFAHGRGVVHRDLKPANIMFRDTGAPVLTDFGIARSQDGSAMRLTQTGMLVGTPTYMSPEQINGVAVDGRADQYSLGILFYELLTGAPPYRADTSIAVLMAHLSQPVPSLPPEFHAFEDVLARMLAKNRDERYQNLNEFSEDLKSRLFNSDTLMLRLQVDPNQPSSEQLRALGFSTSTPSTGSMRDIASLRGQTPVPRSRVPQTPAEPSKRTPWLIGAGVAVALLLGLGGWYLSSWRSAQDHAELIATSLDRAAKRIEAGQLTRPQDGESAYDYLQKVLQNEPNNATAQILLDRLASLAFTRGQAAFAAGNFADAQALIDEGLRVRPKDAEMLALKERIAAQLAPPPAPATPNADSAAPVAGTPAPATTTANAISTANAAAASPTTNTTASKPAVPVNGELLLNALPWANVESVLDEHQQAVKLPADASTPFVLQLPAGKYTVTFRNPLSAKPLQVETTVDAGKRAQAVTAFATTSAQGYLSRAGW
jgi:serine/threonine protein kinase